MFVLLLFEGSNNWCTVISPFPAQLKKTGSILLGGKSLSLAIWSAREVFRGIPSLFLNIDHLR